MKNSIFSIFCSTILVFTSCSNKFKNLKSIAENYSSYSYVPLDPLPIFERPGNSCPDSLSSIRIKYKETLKSLPDQAVRIAIGSYSFKGGLTFGPTGVGVEGNFYQVILDYINVDVTNPIYVGKQKNFGADPGQIIDLYSAEFKSNNSESKDNYSYKITPAPRDNENLEQYDPKKGNLVRVPVYIGVGLRLTASVQILKGSVNLSSLGSLTAAAEAGKLTGTMVVQTLGITGNNVNKILPLPSEINETTIQNSILALASIKAIMDDEETIIEPRVVGIYNSIGGGQEFVNGVISNLSANPAVWYRPCEKNE